MLGTGGWILLASSLATPRQALLDAECWMPNDNLPMTKFDGVVKNPNYVTPAKAIVQEFLK